MMRNFRYAFEYAALRLMLEIFALLPAPYASAAGGAIFRTLGPLMGIDRVARRNLAGAFPDWPRDRIDTTAKEMWDNLGRALAEYPHLAAIARNHTTFRNPEALIALRDDRQPGVLVGGHVGNWEVIPPAMLFQFHFAMHPLYRAPNNPFVDELLVKIRGCGGRLQSFGKNRRGLGQTLKMLESGGHVGMLIDQKMNTGVEALFFNKPAMTSTAFVELARKMNCPLVPVRCIRIEGCRFEIELGTPLMVADRPTEDVIADMHALLENWIREYPAQWLWLHRRWKN